LDGFLRSIGYFVASAHGLKGSLNETKVMTLLEAIKTVNTKRRCGGIETTHLYHSKNQEKQSLFLAKTYTYRKRTLFSRRGERGGVPQLPEKRKVSVGTLSTFCHPLAFTLTCNPMQTRTLSMGKGIPGVGVGVCTGFRGSETHNGWM
jgi:hypothetical protein